MCAAKLAKPAIGAQGARSLRKRLLAWFRKNRLALPWRRNRDPYRVWVSEVMLQQTRVRTVVPYFERFLERFPTLADLAKASQQEVLRAWEGMGYYSRARNLHRAARMIQERHIGKFPRKLDEIGKLPGVGSYTAAAIASIAFNTPVAVLDANVARVLARLAAIEGDLGERRNRCALETLARGVLPRKQPGAFNEALMELGQRVCLPRSPSCLLCPLASFCRARREGRVEEIPWPSRRSRQPLRQYAGVLVSQGEKVLLVQRPPRGLLGGLWDFPMQPCNVRETPEMCAKQLFTDLIVLKGARGPYGRPVQIAREEHTFTHFRMRLYVYGYRLSREPEIRSEEPIAWVGPAELGDFPLPRLTRRILSRLYPQSGPRAARLVKKQTAAEQPLLWSFSR